MATLMLTLQGGEVRQQRADGSSVWCFVLADTSTYQVAARTIKIVRLFVNLKLE